MASDSFHIGPFEILESADRGGMAEVWRGVHRAQRVPVALKVLTGPDAAHPNFLAAFRNEIVAVAGLDHPHIVHIYDHGVIDADIRARSGGRLEVGCPYFVMEWASSGNLAVGARPRTWRELREALVALLDALGHAHARGVIHRDLKRQNVLMCGPDDLRPGWKLADFGMARPPGMEADPLAGGTPGLMSPEQADGRWRDQGPWTDLFALGCLSWVMITGKRGQALPPPAELLVSPPERTMIAVPRKIWGWIARLTEQNPQDRPQFAAQAKAWLLALGDPEPEDEARVDAHAPPPEEAGTNSEATTGQTRTLVMVAVPSGARARGTKTGSEQRLPIPVDWREHATDDSSLRLHGAGLSLFGLRHLPLVGRGKERDELWAGLCRVASSGRPACVILRGPAGTGKSRLARWLSWRAHEVGAAVTLSASHEPTPGPADGIGPMLSRYLRCAGMERAELEVRLEDLVTEGIIPDPQDYAPLLDLLSPDLEDPTGGGDRMHAGREAARRLIAAHAQRQPRIVWIDDAHYDGSSIEFASRLLELSAPVYVVVCVREEDVVARPAIGMRLVELARYPDVYAVDVPPLRDAAWRTMVREILGLEGSLAAELEERAGGTPLFAVHLVGDWVARGLLVPGKTGFRLARGARIEVPKDLHSVWRGHLDALLAGRPAAEATALELAAVLGQDVSVAEWRAACECAKLSVPQALVDALVARRLARSGGLGGEGRWHFVHAMLREALVQRAQEAGRLAGHHAVCAQMLTALPANPSVIERRARHLLAAGDADAALEPLLWSARMRLAAGERDPAAALLVDIERTAGMLELAADHPSRVELALLRAELAGLRGDGAEEARAAEEAARVSGLEPALACRAFHRLGVGQRDKGDLRAAESCFARGVSVAEAAGMPSQEAGFLVERGRVRALRGDLAGATTDLARGEQFFRAAQETAGVATALLGMAVVARQQGAWQRAAGFARTALGYVELTGSRRLLGEVLVELADIARAQGDLTAAEGWYRTALERAHISGTDDLAARLGLVLCLVERGSLGSALVRLQELLDLSRAAGRRTLTVRIRLAMVVCAAKGGEWTMFDEQSAAAEADLVASGLVDPDVRHLGRKAQSLAIGAGEIERARGIRRMLEDTGAAMAG